MKDPNYSVCKIFCHPDKIKDYLDDNIHGPISVEIHPTNRCNFSCKWCEPNLFGRIDKNQEMSRERLLSLVDELKMCDVRGVLISGGGEPLLHSNITEFIDKCFDVGISIGIFTNGSLISDKNIPSLLKCDFVRISFDAGWEKHYNELHGCLKFKNVIKNLKNLIKIRNENALFFKTTIGTSYVISNENCSTSEIEDYISLMNLIGVDYAQLRQVRGKNLVSQEQLKLIKEHIFSRYRKSKTKIIYNPHYNTAYDMPERTYDNCHMTNFQVVIAPNGDMYPCYGFIHRQDKCMGNIKNNFCNEWKKRNININCKRDCVECRFHLQNKMLNDLKNIKHKDFM